MRRHLTLFLVLCTLALGACGTRGSLTLPPPKLRPPASAPAAPNPPAASDLNTAKEPAR